MSLLGRLVALFPFVHAAFIALSLFFAFHSPLAILTLPLAIWVFPLVVWRIHNRIWPLTEGLVNFSKPSYAPWWGSFQFQYLFLVLPGLERILHVVPGLFTWWLRAWGSKVGKGVYWTPHTLILDRTLMDIGDHVIFGHRCSFSSHVISTRRKGELALFLKKVTIGAHSFVGAGCDIGPGCIIDSGSRVPEGSQFYPNTRFPDAKKDG